MGENIANKKTNKRLTFKIHKQLMQLTLRKIDNPTKNLLELTPQKDVLFIIRAWNVKSGSQETPKVTGKFSLKYRMKQGKG